MLKKTWGSIILDYLSLLSRKDRDYHLKKKRGGKNDAFGKKIKTKAIK